MLELDGVKVTLDKRWKDNGGTFNEREVHFLVIEIPLPGGFARYEMEISKDQYDNMSTAHKLSQVGK